MKLQEALKGMCVKSWEIRESDTGRKIVYVRFREKQKTERLQIEG